MLANPDGSFSTERSFSFEADGQHILIPSIVDGQPLSTQDAIRAWREQRNPELGRFNSADEATAASKARSAHIGTVRGIRRLDDDPLGLAGDAETAQAAYRANPPYLGPRALDAEQAQAQYRAEGPRVTFVPLGTPDSIGPGTVTVAQPDPMPDALSDPLGLGPRFAPSPIPGVTAPAPPAGLPFGQRVLRGLEGLSAGIQGRVPAFERRDQAAKAEARQAEADRLGKLKLLAEIADKAATTPELAEFMGRIAQRVAGKDFDAEEWGTLTSQKGLALDAADFAEEMGEEAAARFVEAIRPIRKDPTKVQTVQNEFVKDAKAKALVRLKPDLLRRLRLPEVRAELLNAGDGTAITETALLADLTGEGSGLKRFEREALAEWVQSTEGRQQLLQLGVTPASLTFEAEKAAAIDEAKAANNPALITTPRLAALAAGTVTDATITPEKAKAALDVLKGQSTDLPTLAMRASEGDPKAQAALDTYLDLTGQRAQRTAEGSLKGGGLPASVQEALTQLNSLDALAMDLEMLVPSIEEVVGPVAGRKAGILEATVEGSLTPQQIEARRITAAIGAQITYMLSGKQINEAEAKRLRATIPSETLPLDVFKVRLRGLQRQIRQIAAERQRLATTPAGKLGEPAPIPPRIGPEDASGATTSPTAPTDRPAPQAGPAVPDGAILRRGDGSQWQFRDGAWRRLEDRN